MSDRAEDRDDGGFDPAKRELCSDGMCIGVVGSDGRCKVCGKPGKRPRPSAPEETAAGAPAEGSWRPAAPPVDDDDDDDEDEGDEAPAAKAPRDDEPDPSRERVPCPDGMCTGVIGRNGRCGTCGKPGTWTED